MAQAPLSDEEFQELLDVVAETGSVTAYADRKGIGRSTADSRWQASKAWARRKGLPIPELRRLTLKAPPVEPSPRLPITADEAWEQINGWIGRKRIPKTKPRKWKPGAEQRIVVAGDFHAPFHCPEVVAQLIAEESPRADTLIISGDLMDNFAISRFVKYELVPIEQEIAATDALLSQLAAAFPDIVIVAGNHDGPRLEKQIRGLLSPEMMHCIELLTGGNLSIVKLLAKRHGNVRFAPQDTGTHALDWMTQVGDLVVTHAEKFSRVPGSALRQIDEGLTDFDHVYNLKPWKVLLQAHTHQLGLFPFKADRLLGESGCCCQVHGYQLSARMGGRPQRQGYVTLQQVNGVTDLNSVRFRWLNHERKVA